MVGLQLEKQEVDSMAQSWLRLFRNTQNEYSELTDIYMKNTFAAKYTYKYNHGYHYDFHLPGKHYEFRLIQRVIPSGEVMRQ